MAKSANFSCDGCFRHLEEEEVKLTLIQNGHDHEHHFCHMNCLNNWSEKHVVDRDMGLIDPDNV